MSVSVVEFRARFPEFADDTEYTDARIQLFIDDSIFYIGSDESRWGGKYNVAQAYLTAHLLQLGTSSEVGDSSTKAGIVTSKSAGGVSVSRQVSSKDRSDADEFYISTSYGQRFIIIRNMTFVGVLVANQL